MHASCLTGWCISCSSEGAPARERVLQGSILPDVGFLLPGFSLDDRFVLLKAFDCSPTISITTNRARPTSTTRRPAAAGTRLVRHRDTLPRRSRLVRHRNTLPRRTRRRSRGDAGRHARTPRPDRRVLPLMVRALERSAVAGTPEWILAWFSRSRDARSRDTPSRFRATDLPDQKAVPILDLISDLISVLVSNLILDLILVLLI